VPEQGEGTVQRPVVQFRLRHSAFPVQVAPLALAFAQTPVGAAMVAVQYRLSWQAPNRVSYEHAVVTAPFSRQTPIVEPWGRLQ
jgi:hypothetical protein